MLSKVTFGITTFDRPVALRKLVDSIVRKYPGAIIRVADNGEKRAKLSAPNLTRAVLPFDSGASACRNWLMETSTTPYVFLLDDDFVFQAGTCVKPMLDVMESQPSIGVVGGKIHENKRQAASDAFDLRGSKLVPVKSSMVKTAKGTRYQMCDYVRMFAVMRREIAETTRWDESLKIGGEHLMVFYELKQKGLWRVAWTPDSALHHSRIKGDAKYQQFRGRGLQFERAALAKIGGKHGKGS